MSCLGRTTYEKVLQHEDNSAEKSTDEHLPHLDRQPLRKAVALIAIAIIATFATVFSAVGAAIARQAISHGTNICHATPVSSEIAATAEFDTPSPRSRRFESCGKSPEEARSRGCKFDIMSFVWLPTECYDDGLQQEFLEWSNWTLYTSENIDDETQVPLEVAQLGEQDLFADWTYHMTHCTFMWRQQHLSVQNGWIGDHLVNYVHTLHCQHVLLGGEGHNRNVRTPAKVLYPLCVEVGFEKRMYPGPANETYHPIFYSKSSA